MACEHTRVDWTWSHGNLARCLDCGAVEESDGWRNPVEDYLRLVNSDNPISQQGAAYMRQYLDLARTKHNIPYPK